LIALFAIETTPDDALFIDGHRPDRHFASGGGPLSFFQSLAHPALVDVSYHSQNSLPSRRDCLPDRQRNRGFSDD
jgi:hypothetical protein